MFAFLKQLKIDRYILIVLFIALILRLVYFFLFHPPLTWDDASGYDAIAQNIIQGKGYSLDGLIPTACREPGYSLFFLTPIYFIFGHSLLWVQVFQILLNLIIIFSLYQIVLTLISRPAAIGAAFLASFHYSPIIYNGEILTETFFTFCLFFSFLILLWAYQTKTILRFFITGIALGLTTLVRFNTALIFIALFFPLWILQKSFKKAFIQSSFIGLGIFLIITPWVIRNYIQFDVFVPGRFGGGEIIWSGSYIPWDGEWAGQPWTVGNFPTLIEGLSPPERDQLFLRYAIQNIKENPVAVAWIWVKKPFKILFGEFNTSLETFTSHPFLVYFLIPLRLFHLFVILFAFWGSFLFYFKNKVFLGFSSLIVLYFLASYIPMNPDSRYLIPLLPYLFIFDGMALDYFLKKWFKSFL